MIDSGESCMCICFVFNNNLSSITVFGEKKNVSMLWQMSLRDALKMSLSLTHKTHSKRDFVRAILSFYLFLFRAMRDRSKIESLQPHVILTTPNKWFYACIIASIPCHLTCHPSIPVGCSGLYFSNLIRRDWNWFFMMFCILCVCVYCIVNVSRWLLWFVLLVHRPIRTSTRFVAWPLYSFVPFHW